MPDDPIVARLTVRPGQSQHERLPGELDAHYVDVDERTPARLLEAVPVPKSGLAV